MTGFALDTLGDKVDATVHALKFVVSQNEFREVENSQIVEYDSVEDYNQLTDGHPSDAFRISPLEEY